MSSSRREMSQPPLLHAKAFFPVIRTAAGGAQPTPASRSCGVFGATCSRHASRLAPSSSPRLQPSPRALQNLIT